MAVESKQSFLHFALLDTIPAGAILFSGGACEVLRGRPYRACIRHLQLDDSMINPMIASVRWCNEIHEVHVLYCCRSGSIPAVNHTNIYSFIHSGWWWQWLYIRTTSAAWRQWQEVGQHQRDRRIRYSVLRQISEHITVRATVCHRKRRHNQSVSNGWPSTGGTTVTFSMTCWNRQHSVRWGQAKTTEDKICLGRLTWSSWISAPRICMRGLWFRWWWLIQKKKQYHNRIGAYLLGPTPCSIPPKSCAW